MLRKQQQQQRRRRTTTDDDDDEHIDSYTLTGVAEVFAAIAAFDLFYAQVPASVRSLNQALNLLSIAVGNTFAGAVNSVFAAWLPDNLDHGSLE